MSPSQILDYFLFFVQCKLPLECHEFQFKNKHAIVRVQRFSRPPLIIILQQDRILGNLKKTKSGLKYFPLSIKRTPQEIRERSTRNLTQTTCLQHFLSSLLCRKEIAGRWVGLWACDPVSSYHYLIKTCADNAIRNFRPPRF